jgi:N-acetylglucosamine-6-phosphate deacetylase
MRYLVSDVGIVGPDGVTQGDILIDEGRIVRLGPGAGRDLAKAPVVQGKGLTALPGFIDIHTHGGMGFDLTEGMCNSADGSFDDSPEMYRRAIPMVMARFAKTGVTRAFLATFAAPQSKLRHAMSQLAEYVEDQRNGSDGARLEGGCLEGTFIKHCGMAGAQNPRNFRKPERRVFDALNCAARGCIRYVNVVPEFGEASARFTRYLTEQGVLVGAGHTDCPADQAMKCMEAGLKVIVHFLNGPTGHSPKPFHGGNMVEATLRSDIYVELICDGWHVAPAYVRDVIARKGLHRIVLVTDAMFLAGATGIRSFSLGGKEGIVHPSGKYLQVKDDPGTLFGSVLDMATAFGNVLSWLTKEMEGVWCGYHAAMPLDKALPAAARCAATNAARLLGWDRSAPGGPGGIGTGSLEKGKAADVVIGRLTGKAGAYRFTPRHVFVAGRKVV